jgi:hypothetical protein
MTIAEVEARRAELQKEVDELVVTLRRLEGAIMFANEVIVKLRAEEVLPNTSKKKGTHERKPTAANLRPPEARTT